MDPQTALYLQYYKNQAGGNLPVFSGARRGQYGAGLGDILRGIFRTVLPIAIRGAASFLGTTLKSHDSGSTWKNAALNALPSTAQSITNEAVEKLKDATGNHQEGGRRRRKCGRCLGVQSGGKRKRHGGYKRKRSKSLGAAKSAKRIKFINF